MLHEFCFEVGRLRTKSRLFSFDTTNMNLLAQILDDSSSINHNTFIKRMQNYTTDGIEIAMIFDQLSVPDTFLNYDMEKKCFIIRLFNSIIQHQPQYAAVCFNTHNKRFTIVDQFIKCFDDPSPIKLRFARYLLYLVYLSLQ